jgi:sugar/nucleoside kinase (ribokinase family)
MQHYKIIVTGTGCALADFLYTDISFNALGFTRYLSRIPGDGGLSPGKLVFTEEFEQFAGKSYDAILKELTGKSMPDGFNIGGPGLVSMIHASQLLDQACYQVKFYGSLGNDNTARSIAEKIMKTPLDITNYRQFSDKPTPFTDVFSDPTYDNGHGERTFVNNIGAAWDYLPEMIPEDFFHAHITCFGGTALVPRIHDNLTTLLGKAKQHNCITLVNTVFDFRNEKYHPGRPWPLGNSDDSFRLTDVLIMDQEEALRISGKDNPGDAVDFFIRKEVSVCIITNGANDIVVYSDGRLFENTKPVYYPVSRMVTDTLRRQGDTTGCGDNFAGGIIASLAKQIRSGAARPFSLIEAVTLAVASGAFACTYLGGTYLESRAGEKKELIQAFVDDYMIQISRK